MDWFKGKKRPETPIFHGKIDDFQLRFIYQSIEHWASRIVRWKFLPKYPHIPVFPISFPFNVVLEGPGVREYPGWVVASNPDFSIRVWYRSVLFTVYSWPEFSPVSPQAAICTCLACASWTKRGRKVFGDQRLGWIYLSARGCWWCNHSRCLQEHLREDRAETRHQIVADFGLHYHGLFQTAAAASAAWGN